MESDLSSKRPRGGRIQKHAALQSAAEHQHVHDLRSKLADSELVLELIDSWTRGLSSAAECQRLAMKSYNDMVRVLNIAGKSDGFVPVSLKSLASLGDWGKYSGNVAAELKRWLGEPSMPKPMTFSIPMLVKKPRSGLPIYQRQDLPIMLPHVTFAHIYTNHTNQFNFKFLGTPPIENKLHDFWSVVVARRDPRIVRHPMCAKPNWTHRAIPIAIHGDAVPVYGVGRPTTKSLDCFSWQSLLAFGQTMVVKMLMVAVFDQNKSKSEDGSLQTMDSVWSILCWSLAALFEGRYPSCDWNGTVYEPGTADAMLANTPLTTEDGYFCVLWSVKGDIDWFGKGLNLKKHNANEPCDWCPATKLLGPDMWPTNFTATAPWKTMLRSAGEWRIGAESKHILFEKLEYLSILNIEADELHVLHLGISQYFLGSVLFMLTFVLMPDPAAANLEAIWSFILSEYTKLPGCTQYTCLSLSSFVDTKKPRTSYPRLKGRGSEVKNLVGPMLAVFKRFGATWEHAEHALSGLASLLQINEILDDYRGDAFLPINIALEFRTVMDKFLESYTHLGIAADASGILCFSAVPKLHWAWHLAYRAYWLNPRRVACFLDEDFVKYMKQLASRCACSTQLHRVPIFLMEKYRYGVELDLAKPM